MEKDQECERIEHSSLEDLDVSFTSIAADDSINLETTKGESELGDDHDESSTEVQVINLV